MTKADKGHFTMAIPDVNNPDENYEVHLRVEGMMCQKSCAFTVREALFSIPGSVSATATFSISSASVVVNIRDYCDALEISDRDLFSLRQRIKEHAIQVVDAVGFDASVGDDGKDLTQHVDTDTTVSMEPRQSLLATSHHDELYEDHEVELNSRSSLTLQVGGMSCAACTGRVEKALRQLPFVDDVKVNFATGRAQVQLNEITADKSSLLNNKSYMEEQCVKTIHSVGYDCAILDMAQSSANAATVRDFQEKEISSWRRRLIIACSLSSPLILYHWILMTNSRHMHDMHRDKLGWDEWLGLALATPVQYFVGDRYYKAAYASIKNRSLGMDFLIVLG
jgi:cation transport ATPase